MAFKTFCPLCKKNRNDVEPRYSFGAYAGQMCEPCAVSTYRDGCGLLTGQQGNPQSLDEVFEPDAGFRDDDFNQSEEYYSPFF
jgi:hypothetical protein